MEAKWQDAQWRYNTIPSYELQQEDLRRRLVEKFGNWDFYITVGLAHEYPQTVIHVTGTDLRRPQHFSDHYRVWIPRDLDDVSHWCLSAPQFAE